MVKYIVSYLLVYSGLICAQIVNPVSMSVDTVSPARAGEVISVYVDAAMDDQWKIYSIHKIVEGPYPTEVSLSGDAVEMIGRIIEPEPVEDFDPGFDMISYYHSGDTRFTIPIRLKRDIDPGTYELSVSMFFQVCNQRLCYPPITISDTLSVIVEQGDPRPDRLVLSSKESDSSSGNKYQSILSLIILAIGGAILSLSLIHI